MAKIYPDCPLLTKNKRCSKVDERCACKPSSHDWLDEPPDEFMPANQMCAKSSIFGNNYICLTDADIERLKNGEIAHTRGEYGIFIGYKEKDNA